MPEKESQMTVIDSEFILKPRSVAVFVGDTHPFNKMPRNGKKS